MCVSGPQRKEKCYFRSEALPAASAHGLGPWTTSQGAEPGLGLAGPTEVDCNHIYKIPSQQPQVDTWN